MRPDSGFVVVRSFLLCSDTLVWIKRHISELLVRGFDRPVLLYRDRMPLARGMAAYVHQGHFTNPNLIVAVAKRLYLGFVVPDRTSMYFACIATLT